MSIQTNDNLTIDPKLLTLSAVGNYDLMSKKGDLTLIGHGGTKGNGSEQVVKLNTANGGINLAGQKVELQGTQLNAAKDISIVSTDGDLIVDGVRNTLTNQVSNSENLIRKKEYYQSILNQIDKLKSPEISKDYDVLITLYNQAFFYKPRVEAKVQEFKEAHLNFINKYGVLREKADPDGIWAMTGVKFTSIRMDSDPLGVTSVSKPATLYDNFEIIYSNSDIDNFRNEINFLNSKLNGYEHQGSTLTSNTGNINLASKQGLSISGAAIDAKKGSVLIEAVGTLANEEHQIQGEFKSNIKNSVKQGKIKGSIIIDATQDSYEIGQVTDENYNWRSPVNATTINGDKGVKIKAAGKSATDNLILQGVGITSNNGNVDIEAYKNIIFDVAVENAYDKSKKTETKRKWYGKKKTTTTIKTAERVGGLSVDIDAKNINITSEEAKKADDKETGLHRTSIDMYSSQLTAHGGKVKILAGGDINLLTADNVSKDTLDISKSSSWAGIKLNKSKYTSTRNIKSELPAVLEASYIGAQADGNIVLKGTEFNYLEGADIKAGQEIYLLGASKLVEATKTKTSNSVVWQSMQDQGSITETSKLPTFNGPVAPKFVGSLTVQVPVTKRTANQKELIAEIEKLAKTPGNAYLKSLVDNKDQKVNWEQILLTNEDWDYKSQGLTAAGAAIIAIIVTAVTAGAGASLFGTTTLGGTAMANAAVASLANTATVSLINSGGDLKQAFQALGSKEALTQLVVDVVTAGLNPANTPSGLPKVTPTSAGLNVVSALNPEVGAALAFAFNNGSLAVSNPSQFLWNGMNEYVKQKSVEELARFANKNNLTLQQLNALLLLNSQLGYAIAGTTFKKDLESGNLSLEGFVSRSGGILKGSDKQWIRILWDFNDSLLNLQGMHDAVSLSTIDNLQGFQGELHGHSLGAWRTNNLVKNGYIDASQAQLYALPFFSTQSQGLGGNECQTIDIVCFGAVSYWLGNAKPPVDAQGNRIKYGPLNAVDAHLINKTYQNHISFTAPNMKVLQDKLAERINMIK